METWGIMKGRGRGGGACDKGGRKREGGEG